MLGPVVEAMGYELIGIEFQGGSQHGVLRLYIDSPDGITLEDCEQVSYQVSGVLDVEDPIKGRFSLEISSPGLDRPLFTEAHFERFKGQKAKLKLERPLAGQRNFVGVIAGARDGLVLLQTDDGAEHEFDLADIEKARLVPEF